MLSISVEHDPASGAWDVGHVMFMLIPERRECRGGPWRTATPPRYAEWQKSCPCLPAGDQFAQDAAIELARVVSGVQKRCSCRQCGKALESAEWLDVAEAARLAAIAADPDGQHARAMVSTGATARERRESAITPPSSYPPITYATARERYMDTGTIAHKEAMLSCVTMTEPDLDTIGSEWEPEPPAVPSRPQRVTRSRVALALVLAAVILAAVNGLVLHAMLPVTLICCVLVSSGVRLSGKPKARK